MITKFNLILFSILLILVFIFRVISLGGIDLKPEKYDDAGTYASVLRESFANRVDNLLPQPQAALLSGMVFGEKQSLPKEFSNALRRTSTIHIVVVSGQNLTLLAGFVLAFANILGRKKCSLAAMIICLLYAYLTGFGIPVIRALIMVFLYILAQLLNRESQGAWAIFLTALLMLIYNPSWIASLSFQLSFLATIGVVILAPEIEERIKFLPDILKTDFSVSLAAQVLTIPVIAYNFHQLSLIGILVNSLILWTVPFIMIFGVIALLVSYLNLMLGAVFMVIPNIFLTYFVYVVEFSNQRWASYYVPATNPILWIGYYLLILGAYLGLKREESRNVSPEDNRFV